MELKAALAKSFYNWKWRLAILKNIDVYSVFTVLTDNYFNRYCN